jgi:hypothetical protein
MQAQDQSSADQSNKTFHFYRLHHYPEFVDRMFMNFGQHPG